ncbi:MAG: hypothetical protein R3362_10615, partial [Rhodothermales bacterium]|nr:hypothetical protein [Rhodothermales bacterium]
MSSVAPPKPAPSIWHDYVHELYPRTLVGTIRRYLFDHGGLFDEAFAGNWEGKIHPIPFFFTAISLLVFLFSLLPDQYLSPAWTDVTEHLDEQDQVEVVEAFGLYEAATSAASEAEVQAA